MDNNVDCELAISAVILSRSFFSFFFDTFVLRKNAAHVLQSYEHLEGLLFVQKNQSKELVFYGIFQ